jgi:hypothetical protein
MKRPIKFILFGVLLGSVSVSHAIRMDCSDGLTSELPLKFQLKIPEFFVFSGRAGRCSGRSCF